MVLRGWKKINGKNSEKVRDNGAWREKSKWISEREREEDKEDFWSWRRAKKGQNWERKCAKMQSIGLTGKSFVITLREKACLHLSTGRQLKHVHGSMDITKSTHRCSSVNNIVQPIFQPLPLFCFSIIPWNHTYFYPKAT